MRRIHIIGLSFFALLLSGVAGGGAYYWHKRLTPEALDLRGAQLMHNCRRCHSLEAGRSNTGPTLIGIWGREAGTDETFERYSPALRASRIVWNAETLDRWLKNPPGVVPGTSMTNGEIEDDKDRAILIRWLERASTGKIDLASAQGRGDYGYPPGVHTAGHMVPGMGNRLSNEHLPLKEMPAERQVKAINLCRDTYIVTHGDGRRVLFWEANVRFKTDSSGYGPHIGVPVVLPSSTMGDRVTVIFTNAGEIGRFVQATCESTPVAKAPESTLRR
jgi:cytochrome c